MRIKIELSSVSNEIPILEINNQHLLNGFLHKCLGENNEYHDKKSEYSMSMLRGGKMNDDKKTVSFKNGAHFYVSSSDNEFMNKLIMGLITNGDFGHNLKFKGIIPVEEKFFNGINYFKTLSPVLFKINETNSFVNIDDDNYESKLQDYMKHKLSKINPNLDLNDFSINVQKHENNKIKLIKVRETNNKASLFQFSVQTNKKVAETIYNYGVGKSTGSGFGCVYKTENYDFYRD